jgi:uncharacterized protein YjbI with pentapeptide repeats
VASAALRLTPIWSDNEINEAKNADLRRANLQEANLREADFAGALLEETNLIEANLIGTRLTPEQRSQARLRETIL